jgi:ribonuclease R
MPERYADAILKYLADRSYQPIKPRQLARQMGIAEEEYGTFREAVKVLRDSGRIVLGAKDSLMLPEIASRIVGFYRPNPRGFGFVVPETPNAHADLFIPEGASGGAMNGDLVRCRVVQTTRREGKSYVGQVIEVVRRGSNRFVGTLEQTQGTWFVLPEGKQMATPIVVRDISSASPPSGTKVVAEIVQYATKAGDLPVGVIVEALGAKGELEVETLSVIRAHGLEDTFSEAALSDARAAIAAFERGMGVPPMSLTGVSPVPEDGKDADKMSATHTGKMPVPLAIDGREDLTALTIVTVDPPDARDYDDAISLESHGDGAWTLGVHIADVSHFVREGTTLDEESRRRGTSTYFPKKVVPMLPEILSNGVCSLQEGQRRFCQSAFIRYDSAGEVTGRRYARSVIRSAKRLTYLQAQDILDGKTGGYEPRVIKLVSDMHKLARVIEARRRRAGMLHLDLPEVELVFDEHDKVVDAVKEDSSYTHTIIEMFMVEANEAVATLLSDLKRPFLRRIHPSPDQFGSKQLIDFVHACGHKLPAHMTRKDMQELLAAVKGKPESYAVNLALLKTFEQAEYSPMAIGHFALASENYCHFTSPIRRYPDLTVHRLVEEYCRRGMGVPPMSTTGILPVSSPSSVSSLAQEQQKQQQEHGQDARGTHGQDAHATTDLSALVRLGEHCTAAEKRSQGAEGELRDVLILQFLATRLGDVFDGVITGVTNFGMFVQSMRFLIEGLVRLEDLGDDWWEVNGKLGLVVGQRSGKRFRIGDVMTVRIANVDLARRRLNLAPERTKQPQGKGPSQREPKSSKGPKGANAQTTPPPQEPRQKKKGKRSRRRG